jgi:hypothetical protein
MPSLQTKIMNSILWYSTLLRRNYNNNWETTNKWQQATNNDDDNTTQHNTTQHNTTQQTKIATSKTATASTTTTYLHMLHCMNVSTCPVNLFMSFVWWSKASCIDTYLIYKMGETLNDMPTNFIGTPVNYIYKAYILYNSSCI